MKIEDKYILLDSWEYSDGLIKELVTYLESSKLNNVILSESEGSENAKIAKGLNEILCNSNGLAVVFGPNALKSFKSSNLDCVIGLPTKHEAIEAVMMNILENEFLSQGS